MKKDFDCVAMKDDIQRRLLREMRGLSPERQRAAIHQTLQRSRSPVGVLWRALVGGGIGSARCVAEGRAPYGRG